MDGPSLLSWSLSCIAKAAKMRSFVMVTKNRKAVAVLGLVSVVSLRVLFWLPTLSSHRRSRLVADIAMLQHQLGQ